MEIKEITVTTKDFLNSDVVFESFSKMLGNNTQGFINTLINIVSDNDLLVKAERNSLVFAAMNSASMNLPINPNLGFAYIVPYKSKRKEVVNGKDVWIEEVKAQFQMGYKGFIQLAMRSGQFKTISAAPICEGQIVSENPLTGYEFDFTVKSKNIVGYAGYFEMISGFRKTLYMTNEELKQHGTRYSQSFKKGYGLWEDDFDAMATKTVLKLLLSKYGLLSPELQRAFITDQAVLNSADGTDLSYIDNKQQSKAEEMAEKKNQDERKRVSDFIDGVSSIEELEKCDNFVMELPEDDEVLKKYNLKLEELKGK